MGLIFDVLSAINNPNTEGNVDQLAQVMNTVKQIAGENGVSDSTLQSVLSGLGGMLRPALKQQGIGTSPSGLDNLLGGGLSSLLTGSMTQQMVKGIAAKTGLNEGMLQGVIPVLVPAVLGLFKMGKTKPGVVGGNPLLNAFLDGDKDGDVDLGDAFKFASRFLNAPHG